MEGGGKWAVNGAFGVGGGGGGRGGEGGGRLMVLWGWVGGGVVGGVLSRSETKVIIRQLSAQRHRPAHGEPVTGSRLVWTDW